MKWKFYPLSSDDSLAKEHFLKHLSIGAHDHMLTRKLLEFFSQTEGSIFAIAHNTIELDRVVDYSNGAFYCGCSINEASQRNPIAFGERPIDGLISFLTSYLELNSNQLLIFENWGARQSDLVLNRYSSRFLLVEDSVYHVLTSMDADPTKIEEAYREANSHFLTGICSEGLLSADDVNLSEDLADQIVSRTRHIFTSAFDGEGFLLWSNVID